MYEQNIIDLRTSWYILSYAFKFQGDKRIQTCALPDYRNYKKDKEDDSAIVKDLMPYIPQPICCRA